MMLDAAEKFEFGPFTLDLAKSALMLGGAPVPLGSRAFSILEFLLAHRDRVVSRKEIEDHVWGGLAVGPGSLGVQMALLRAALAPHPDAKRLIRTVPGTGYRFVGDVAVRALPFSPPPSSTLPLVALPALAAPEVPPKSRLRLIMLSNFLVLVLVSAAIWARWGIQTRLPGPPRFSIAVLPFRNLGENRTQDYLADAISDDLTTDLSHIPGSIVIARESADTFKGRSVAAQEIGRALNVRYLLEGSVRTEDTVFHINAQLIDATSGAHLWADHFDIEREHVTEAQTEIVGRIGSAVNFEIPRVEANESLRDRPNNPDSLDMYFRARSILDRDTSEQGFDRAQALLEKAIARQPDFGDAMASLAWIMLAKITTFEDRYEDEDLAEAKLMIARALKQNPRNVLALAAQALAWSTTGNCVSAEYSARAALVVNPSSIEALGVQAQCAQFEGRLEDAASALTGLLRLDPQGHLLKLRYLSLATIRVLQQHYDQAAELLRWATAGDPEPVLEDGRETMGRVEFARILMIATTALQGDLTAAHRLYENYNRIWQHRSVWRVAAYFHRHQTEAAGFKSLESALGLAGMPQFAHDAIEFQDVSQAQDDRFSPTPRVIAGGAVLDTEHLTALIKKRQPTIIIDLGHGASVIDGAVWRSPDSTGTIEAFALGAVQSRCAGDRTKTIVVMSDGIYGSASFLAATKLISVGYSNVLWYRGGEEAWAAGGGPSLDLRP